VVGDFVEHRTLHPSAEADVASEVEPVGHVVEVGEDLSLAGIALTPLPLLLELVGDW